MAKALSSDANALARELVRSLSQSDRFKNQTTLGKALGLDQGAVSRLLAPNAVAGTTVDVLIVAARLTGRTAEAARALGLIDDVPTGDDETIPEGLRLEIARDPSRLVGIAAAKTMFFAKGSDLPQEQWRRFIDMTENGAGAFESFGRPMAHEPQIDQELKERLQARKSARRSQKKLEAAQAAREG